MVCCTTVQCVEVVYVLHFIHSDVYIFCLWLRLQRQSKSLATAKYMKMKNWNAIWAAFSTRLRLSMTKATCIWKNFRRTLKNWTKKFRKSHSIWEENVWDHKGIHNVNGLSGITNAGNQLIQSTISWYKLIRIIRFRNLFGMTLSSFSRYKYF